MLIREADLGDADGLASCIVASWLQAHRDQIPPHLWERRRGTWTVDVSASAWERTIQAIDAQPEADSHVLVATKSATVIGLVAAVLDDAGEGEVTALYVAPSHQGQGVGRRLLGASLDMLRSAGAPSARVVVLTANTPARRFYRRLGGREAGTAEVDEGGEALPAVMYRWLLRAELEAIRATDARPR